MDKDLIKNKAVSIGMMILILSTLYGICYMWFYRNIEVDLMKPIQLTYSGESGVASVNITSDVNLVNQRITQFYDSVVYEIEPKSQLSNGDTIKITATFDEELAQRYHIKPIHETKILKVENLPEKIDSIFQLPYAYQKDLKVRGENYLKKNVKSILENDFYEVDLQSGIQFDKQEFVGRYFLKAHDMKQHDRILDIYLIYAKGDKENDMICYGVTYSGINTSFEAEKVSVYGEKLYFHNEQDFNDEDKLMLLLKRRYQTYDLYELNMEI